MSNRKRGIICAYCGMAWGYVGESPTPELIKEACDHEAVCDKNPYTAQIRNLKHERDEARAHWGTESMNAAQFLSEKTKAIAERDEAREELEMWRDGNIMHENHKCELEKAERERDIAKEELHRLTGKLGDMWEANMAIGRERDELRKEILKCNEYNDELYRKLKQK